MTVDERKSISNANVSNVIQNLVLESREKLSISGVVDVLSFDDTIVILDTELRTFNSKRRELEDK